MTESNFIGAYVLRTHICINTEVKGVSNSSEVL